jgi:CHASE2 domain-containing sensor protein
LAKKRGVRIFAAIFVMGFAAALKADEFAERFAVVMIDDESEAKLGPFPYDRWLMAQAVNACAHCNARAVVLKFFFDQPKSAAGDDALCKAIATIPVALQARLDSKEGTAEAIPEKFSFGQPNLLTAIGGNRGWIPLPALLETASAVGFVDFDSSEIPLVEEYRGVSYKSLVICCLELAFGAQAHIGTSDRIYVGPGFIPVDRLNVYRADMARLEPLKIISFARLLGGEVKREEIEGRVVIIGLDSTPIPTILTEHGRMGIHRFFVQCLAASFRTLMANQQLLDPMSRQEKH